MNDLTDLRDAWGQPDPPTQTAYSTARAALMRQIAAENTPVSAPRPVRGRGVRLAWLTGTTAVTTALAAAAVVALAPGTTQPGTQPDQSAGQVSGQSPRQLSGQQVLLAAATVAEAKPAGAGAYWHVKQSVTLIDDGNRVQTLNTWAGHDGTEYVMPENATGVFQMTKGGGFPVGASRLTYGQLRQLPTDPDALKTWITDSFNHPSTPPSDRTVGRPGSVDSSMPAPPVAKVDIPAEAMPGTIAGSLSEMLWQVPAPPAVRAAAFRALASMPNVTNLGTTEGGQALRISFPPPPADKWPNGKAPAGTGEIRLLVDPATSMLLSQTNYQGTIKILTAEWTNEMPKVVQPSNK